MTDNPTGKCRPPMGGGGGRLLPPKLIITRSKTPPKHYLPPVRVSSHPKLGTQQQPSCMASVSRQYSPASQASSPSIGHFKCRSNPTSPNFLQPRFFEFEASSQHAPLRPTSASRFGRQSPGLCLSTPLTKPISSKGQLKSNSTRALAPTPQTTSVFPNGNLSSTASSTLLCRRSQVAQAQSSAQLGQDFSCGSSKILARNGPANNGVRRQQWNKYFGVKKSVDVPLLEAPPVTNGARNKRWNGFGYLDRSNAAESNSGSSSFQGNLPCNMNAGNGRGKGHAPIQSSSQRSNKVEDNGSPCEDSSEKESKEDGESHISECKAKASMSPKALRAKLALLGESLSIDVQDSHVTGQDFGIRDYLSMTNESIDNEEESSLAGDFNIGLGIRPPRFSIDSLDSHMSMLLEMNETKDTLQPLSNAQPSSSQTIRRNSDEIGMSRRQHNGDAHNHGESNSCGPSGKLLRKSNSMPHASTLPKIQEGACTVIGARAPLAQESVGAKSRDGQCIIRMAPNHRQTNQQRSTNLSRDKGTIEELEDDEDWKMDDCLVTYVNEIREEP